ncbi:putative mRNA-decapping enzyme [Podospora fimiseda]|uniref:mRNA-decapping enzyme n=1 Tax=Podospora fimiseda TaxID=252190 RepID=A0AAN6YNM0_9PEZI|nr:putative mRNA-decapping enzyme [Podospora fimiseda]
MNRSTPRKSRHRAQPSSGRQQIQASDYESDTAYYMETRDMAPQPPSQTRSDMEINLSVLRRHDPTILSILAIAANAVIYTFLGTTGGWEKHGIEGTLFVCEQQPVLGSLGQPKPSACVFILNRRGMNNLILDLSRISDCEVVEELIVFRLEDGYSPDSAGIEDGNISGSKVLGIWMHSDETRPREVNMEMIQAAWREARLTPTGQSAADETASVAESQVGGAALTGPVAGRQLNIADLFAK